ncbi:hypothetical protein, partial [Xenorhabdus nematophila]|uniref:hypothetical protein n=1 Tax=Xenorhabdus nematophila TaxID=628 RepID=UPI003BB4AA3D
QRLCLVYEELRRYRRGANLVYSYLLHLIVLIGGDSNRDLTTGSNLPARPKPPLPEPPLNGRMQAHWQKIPTSGLLLTRVRFLDHWILPMALSG